MHLRNAFNTSGFCILPTLLSSSLRDQARQSVERLHARALSGLEPDLEAQCVFEKDLPAAKRGGRTVDGESNAVFVFPDPSRYDPSFLSLLAAPGLVALVRDLLGTDDIVIHFANITSKSPEIGSGISWHRDFPNKFICPQTPHMLRTMICLDGMDASAGATRFIAGSQHSPDIKGADIADGDDRIITATCEPGAVVAIHPLVLHGGMPNASQRPRRNIVIQWGVRDNPLVTDNRDSITGLSIAELNARAMRARDDEAVSP